MFAWLTTSPKSTSTSGTPAVNRYMKGVAPMAAFTGTYAAERSEHPAKNNRIGGESDGILLSILLDQILLTGRAKLPGLRPVFP